MFTIKIGFDETTHRYYVVESDTPGLFIETDTYEEFVMVAKDFVPDLVGGGVRISEIEFKQVIALA